MRTALVWVTAGLLVAAAPAGAWVHAAEPAYDRVNSCIATDFEKAKAAVATSIATNSPAADAPLTAFMTRLKACIAQSGVDDIVGDSLKMHFVALMYSEPYGQHLESLGISTQKLDESFSVGPDQLNPPIDELTPQDEAGLAADLALMDVQVDMTEELLAQIHAYVHNASARWKTYKVLEQANAL